MSTVYRSMPAPVLLPMSQIICDAPLLSPLPTDAQPSQTAAQVLASAHALYAQSQSFFDSFGQYSSPAYPGGPTAAAHAASAAAPSSATTTALKIDPHVATPPQLCLTPALVFDSAPPSACPSPGMSSSSFDDDLSPHSLKRSCSPSPDGSNPNGPKKPRAVSTRDFVPPDVSGLSKREARLVKNRAAAFLSRQRKREEFELMEVRVAELENDNVRLRSGLPAPDEGLTAENDRLRAEMDQLRAQLAASEARATELAEQLARAAAAPPAAPVVKPEPVEPRMPSCARARSVSLSRGASEARSAASVGLMVLLCALPSLLGQSAVIQPTRVALPWSSPSSSVSSLSSPSYRSSLDAFAIGGHELDGLDFASLLDADMDVDHHHHHAHGRRLAHAPATKIHLAGAADDLALDISFDTAPAADGSIRVRVHPPPAPAPAPTPAWPSAPADPFLGVGGDELDFLSHSSYAPQQPSVQQGTRRVRIQLAKTPSTACEGGEWDVAVC